MQATGLKICNILIYLFLLFFLVTQIMFVNRSLLSGRELTEVRGTAFHSMSPIVLLLYGVLVHNNLLLRRKRMLMLDSFFVAAILLLIGSTFFSIAALLLVVFALFLVVSEIRKAEMKG